MVLDSGFAGRASEMGWFAVGFCTWLWEFCLLELGCFCNTTRLTHTTRSTRMCASLRLAHSKTPANAELKHLVNQNDKVCDKNRFRQRQRRSAACLQVVCNMHGVTMTFPSGRSSAVN
jgi:hypothetical protein